MSVYDLYEYHKKNAERESEIDEHYSNFLFKYLLLYKKKKIVKITIFSLALNSIPPDIVAFMKRQKWSIDFGYIEVIKQKKQSVKIILTDLGFLMADTIKYDKKIIKPNYFIWIVFIIALSISRIIKFIPIIFKKTFSKQSGKYILKIFAAIAAIMGFLWICIQVYEWAVIKGLI